MSFFLQKQVFIAYHYSIDYQQCALWALSHVGRVSLSAQSTLAFQWYG